MSKSFAMCVVALGCGSVAQPAGDGAQIRVAHVSPGAPAVDFCLAPHGTASFTGPVLAGAGRAAGLSYATVTRYFPVEPGQYDVRLVAPGAADCQTPLAGLDDFTRLPTLDAGAAATIAAEGLLGGQGAAAFTLRGYADDTGAADGQARLRFIHASPGTPAVDAGSGGGALFSPIFSNIEFGAASAISTPPLEDLEISARAHGTTSDVISAANNDLPAGAIATAFAIGQIGNAETPLRILLCTDNAEPNGVHSICSVVGDDPARARVRVAHLSPDTPAVDICLAPAGTGAFGAPLIRTLATDATGLAYPQVTGYLDLPIGRYDVRVVHASTGSCATPSIPDTAGVALAAGEVVTVAALGDLEPAGAAAHDPALHLAVFRDAASPPSDQLRLRFIHASPGTPAVDVGVGSGAGFARVFANVGFGGIATHAPLDEGYLATAPFTNALSARLAGGAADALTTPHLAFAAGSLWTAFAIGGKTGQAENPLRVLLCNDNRPATGLLAACTIAPVIASPPVMHPASLLALVAARHPGAVRDCIARYGALVWSIAKRFEGADAEDAVQEIFLDLWKSAARFDPGVASEPAFVAMIARRRLIDRQRTRRRAPATEAIAVEPMLAAPGAGPDACVEAQQAARAMERLRPEQRHVLVLATCHGLSHGEIAAQTGMPLGTVKAHARRGLQSIRAALLGVQEEVA